MERGGPGEPSAGSRARTLAGRILIVDDDAVNRDVVRKVLESGGHTVLVAESGRQAIRAFELHSIDAAIVELRLKHEDGLQVMEQLLARDHHLPVIIMTVSSSVTNVIQSVRRGAFSYLTRPSRPAELLREIEKAFELRGATEESAKLEPARGAATLAARLQLVGQCPAMQLVRRTVLQVAPTKAIVTIYGESGTGKECVARAIHTLSPRAGRPFIAVNCATVPDSLLESELFGHVQGAFTDARHDRIGLFREADGGTIFLDEVGDTSQAFQVSLLRVLQEQQIRPLGSVVSIPIDTRVIVASNKDLKHEIQAGRFREDLYYRIHILPVYLTPLRERDEDVLLLAEHFLRRYSREEGREIVGFHPSARERLLRHKWPGNVRELENCIKRAVILSRGSLIYPSDLFDEAQELMTLVPETFDHRSEDEANGVPPYKEAKEQFERHYLARLLRVTRGNVSSAARKAGRYRADLYYLFRKHGLDPNDFK